MTQPVKLFLITRITCYSLLTINLDKFLLFSNKITKNHFYFIPKNIDSKINFNSQKRSVQDGNKQLKLVVTDKDLAAKDQEHGHIIIDLADLEN